MWLGEEKVQVLCKKSVPGYSYIVGEMHDAKLEYHDDCTLIWIYQKRLGEEKDKYGGRFSVEGNVLINNEPYWSNYRLWFYDIKSLERREKLNKIMKNI